MQPLVFFLGGLTLLLGVGVLVYRDLSPAVQDAVERRVLVWLRRTRAEPAVGDNPPMLSLRRLSGALSEAGVPAERVRRARTKAASARSAASTPPRPSDPPDGPPAV